MTKRLPFIILWIGIIWLFFSIIYLFSNTPDKNQNTISKLQNTKIEKTEDKITRTADKTSYIQEENYSNKNEEYIQSKQNKKELTQQNEILIIMPGYFFNNDFIALAKKIKEKENIIIKYQSFENLQQYKNFLNQVNTWKNNADIFLIPTDRITTLEQNHIKKINTNEDINTFFNQIFSHYNTTENYSFIPHAIDPLVTFIWHNTNLETNNRTMWKTLSYLTLWQTEKSLSLPILRGISKNDIRLLEINKESFPNYFSILYNLIYQFKQKNNIKAIEEMLQLSKIESEYKRDYVRFIEIIKRIEKRNTHCQDFPDICLFSYKFGDIKFGYLSDLVIWDKYFSDSNRTFSDIDIVNFPISSDVYKVRWRWFVINKDSEKDKAVDIFFQYYLQAWVNNEFALRNNIRSAHNTIFDFQKTQKKYQNILKYEKQFSLIHNGRDLQNNFLQNTETIDLLKWTIWAKEYLERLDRNR